MFSKLFRFFEKKSAMDSSQEEAATNNPTENNITKQSEKITRLSVSELTPVDILMLHYASGTKVGEMQFAGFWNYLYEIDPNDLLNKLIFSGLINKSYNIESNLNSSTVSDLKEVLKKMNIPVSGTKKVLISRLLSSLSISQLHLHFPEETYELSETAKRTLDENEHVPFFHSHLAKTNITIFEADQIKKKEPSYNKFQIAYRILNERKERNKLNNNWGLYRNDIHSISVIQYIEGNLRESLTNLFLVCFFDLSGMDNNFNLNYMYIFERGFFPYEKSFCTIAPGIISKIISFQKKLNLNTDDFQRLYFETIDQVEAPFHLFTKEETYQILILEIEKDIDSLKKIYRIAKHRYLKSKDKMQPEVRL
ncbi:SAP domain-containing protein [Paenibacillus woosongensis]|uniref:SAP domain-containing protein n=1 Tax=Paenibacillus woosongensis TaxID=307580 RepID=A0A7X3CNS7_9BACL|nr:SAP domain-containing protein [Paenibacillus woosongensis]MUG45477.1 hypothetical protein [Paenibacillus woosongensis]